MTTALIKWEPSVPIATPDFVLVSDPKTFEDAMAEKFPVFCGRICNTCHADVRDILPTCPIVKFDSYLYLSQYHNMARISRLLRSEIERTVDEDLIHRVKVHAAVRGNIQRRNMHKGNR